jgi:hypothetical protein
MSQLTIFSPPARQMVNGLGLMQTTCAISEPVIMFNDGPRAELGRGGL